MYVKICFYSVVCFKLTLFDTETHVVNDMLKTIFRHCLLQNVTYHCKYCFNTWSNNPHIKTVLFDNVKEILLGALSPPSETEAGSYRHGMEATLQLVISVS